MSNAARGSAFERRCAVFLEKLGYEVTRSAGSHGPADLVAGRTGVHLAVQCKINGRLDPDEWDELVASADRAGSRAILVYRGPKPRCPLIWWWIQGPKVPRARFKNQAVEKFDPEVAV